MNVDEKLGMVELPLYNTEKSLRQDLLRLDWATKEDPIFKKES